MKCRVCEFGSIVKTQCTVCEIRICPKCKGVADDIDLDERCICDEVEDEFTFLNHSSFEKIRNDRLSSD
jgi:hypothetical protein